MAAQVVQHLRTQSVNKLVVRFRPERAFDMDDGLVEAPDDGQKTGVLGLGDRVAGTETASPLLTTPVFY